jgi:tetratricopeptide (TPR) repeat protein
MGHRTEALEWLRQALEIDERLARENPSVTVYQESLAVGYINIGIGQNDTGHPAEALESFRRARAIGERLARDHPTAHRYQNALGVTLLNMSEIEMGHGRWREAQQLLEQAIGHQRTALAVMPHYPSYQQIFGRSVLDLVSVHQALNQPTEAVRLTREWAALVGGNPGDLYNVACALALSIPLVPEDQKPALAAEAVQTLKESIAAGWSDAQHMSRDPDLAPLHNRDDFHRLLAELFDRGFPADPFAQ